MRRPSSSTYSKPLPRRRRMMPGLEQSTRRSRATDRVCPAARPANHRGQALGAAYPGSMPASLDGLSRAQLAAVTHPEGPLLVLAGAGTGKTRTLTSRFAWLVEQGVPAEQILALTFSSPAAAEMRERLEALIESPYESLHVATFHAFCARLLQDEALEACVDPFLSPVTPGRPAGAPARAARRPDDPPPRDPRQPGAAAGELRGADRPPEGRAGDRGGVPDLRGGLVAAAEEEGDAARATAARELEFAGIYADHDRLLSERGALDFGDLVMRAFRLLHERPHVRERTSQRYRHVLVDEYQDTNFAQGMLLGLLVDAHRNVTVVGDDDQAIYRFRGASQKNLLDFQREFPDAEVIRLERNHRSGRRILTAAQAVVEPCPDRIGKELRGASGGRVRFWRCRSDRAQAQAVAAEAERLIADGVSPDQICVLDALGEERGRRDVLRARGARDPLAHVRLGRLLPARRGARRARLAARARRPERLGRGGARAVAAAGRAALGGRGAADPAGAPAQARHAVGDRRRAGGAAALRGGARPRARVPAPLPLGLPRVRGPPPRRLRAAPDRAHRAAPPAGLRHARRHGRAAAQHRQAAGAGHRLHAPRAAGHGARLHPLPHRRGRVRSARGGGHRRAERAGGAGDDDARRQGARVRPRVRARPVRVADAGRAPGAPRRGAGRAPEGAPAGRRRPRHPRGRDAAPAPRGHDARAQGPRAGLVRDRAGRRHAAAVPVLRGGPRRPWTWRRRCSRRSCSGRPRACTRPSA